MHNQKGWRRLNLALLVVIILINCYTLFVPLWPALTFWWQKNHSQTQATLEAAVHSQEPPQQTGNRLLVPNMLLDDQILGGDNPATVDQGIWRVARTSTPPEGGNTVLIGHRFTYNNKGVFYHLDKLKPGDQLAVIWEGKKYVYTVTETKVVPPTAIEVEAPTDDARLTLYTCTPLWSSKDRLVVIAKPIETSTEEHQ